MKFTKVQLTAWFLCGWLVSEVAVHGRLTVVATPPVVCLGCPVSLTVTSHINPAYGGYPHDPMASIGSQPVYFTGDPLSPGTWHAVYTPQASGYLTVTVSNGSDDDVSTVCTVSVLTDLKHIPSGSVCLGQNITYQAWMFPALCGECLAWEGVTWKGSSTPLQITTSFSTTGDKIVSVSMPCSLIGYGVINKVVGIGSITISPQADTISDNNFLLRCSMSSQVTVTISPDPAGTAEADLPSGWTVTGGNIPAGTSGKLVRMVPRNSQVNTLISAACGTSAKSCNMVVYEASVCFYSDAVIDPNIPTLGHAWWSFYLSPNAMSYVDPLLKSQFDYGGNAGFFPDGVEFGEQGHTPTSSWCGDVSFDALNAGQKQVTQIKSWIYILLSNNCCNAAKAVADACGVTVFGGTSNTPQAMDSTLKSLPVSIPCYP